MIKISVVTAVFNRKKTVAQALESVLTQSYPSVETIVIDGGSNDGTLSVLESYRTRLNFLISEPDQGIYDALNKGIKHATGDVIGFLHADDFFEDNEVLSKVAMVLQDTSIDAVYGDLVYVSHDDAEQVIRYWKSGVYDDDALSRGWMPPHPTFYVRKSVYERLGGFDTRYSIAADYDTILRFLAVEKIRTVYIPQVLVRMRAGGISNGSLKTIIHKSIEDVAVLRRNNIGGLLTLLRKNFSKLNQFWIR
jgi:glycosyltransferase